MNCGGGEFNHRRVGEIGHRRVGKIGHRRNFGGGRFDHRRVGEIGHRVNYGWKELQAWTEWCCLGRGLWVGGGLPIAGIPISYAGGIDIPCATLVG